MAHVQLERVAKTYGDLTALEALDLQVREGEFLTLLGPSGCGKTTTLRLIAGFLKATSGRILIEGNDVSGLPPQLRQIGMVFQDYALFPHMTIEENIGFGLTERRVARPEIVARVRELLDLVHLPGVEGRYPAELSGGQRQRVALARAVAYPPRVLLMDEPLGALDLKLREAMQLELRRIQRELGITTIYVTHDQTEAMTMSDRIAIMNLGRLIQLGAGGEIYRRPRTKFVADFVGRINFLDARITGRQGDWLRVEAAETGFDVPRGETGRTNGEITVAIRPEHLRILPADTGPAEGAALPGLVGEQTFTGNLVTVKVRIAGDAELMVECRPDDLLPESGSQVRITWAPERAVVLEE